MRAPSLLVDGKPRPMEVEVGKNNTKPGDDSLRVKLR